MDAAIRETAAREIAELSREQAAWVLAFMAGMEAERRLTSAEQERKDGKEKNLFTNR